METRRAKYAHRDTHINPESDKSDDDDDDDASFNGDDSESWNDNDEEVIQLNNKAKINNEMLVNKKEAKDVILVTQAPTSDLTCNWCLDVFDNDQDLKAHFKLHSTLTIIKRENTEGKCKSQKRTSPHFLISFHLCSLSSVFLDKDSKNEF